MSSRRNEGERVGLPSDEVSEAAERELGTADAKRKHEVRGDGSVAYFDGKNRDLSELGIDEEQLREQAADESEIPPRETGTPEAQK